MRHQPREASNRTKPPDTISATETQMEREHANIPPITKANPPKARRTLPRVSRLGAKNFRMGHE